MIIYARYIVDAYRYCEDILCIIYAMCVKELSDIDGQPTHIHKRHLYVI